MDGGVAGVLLLGRAGRGPDRAALSRRPFRLWVAAASSNSVSASGCDAAAPAMTFSCDPDSSPRRKASVVAGNEARASEASRTPMASPTAVLVFSAIHDAEDRCPSSRHAVPSVARRA